MKYFFSKYKNLISLAVIFLAVRIVVFMSFWKASLDKGGWLNFFRQTDLWLNALVRKELVPYCDGQPPLYTTFTTLVRFIHDSYFGVIFFQLVLSLISLFFIYKISRLVLSRRLSYAVVVFMAFEPYRAWFDFLLGSEILYTPFFLVGLYSFFLFYKNRNAKYLYYSAGFIVLASLTRSNSFMLVPALSIGILAYYPLSRFYLKKDFVFGLKKTIVLLLFFNLIYFAGIAPWMIRHKELYGQYALATIFSTNVYFYNVPELLAQVNNTSFDYEKNRLTKQAEEHLGVEITNYADCGAYDRYKYKEMISYFKTRGVEIIKENKLEYLKVHGLKAIPFFFSSGYNQMYGAYTGDYGKPNVSSAIIKGDFKVLASFAKEGGVKFWLYLIGLLFWELCSLAVFVNLLLAIIKKDEKLFYLSVIVGVLIYSALVVSPFMVPRYALSTAPLFVISLMVLLNNIYSFKKNKQ